MAWLSVIFAAGAAPDYTALNNLANDIRNWGGDVNGGGYGLSNVVRVVGTANKLAIGASFAPQCAVDVFGGGSLWKNNITYELFASTDRIIQSRGAVQSVISLISDADSNGAALGGLYFGRSSGQADAHVTVAGVRGVQVGTGSVAGGALAFFVKGAGSAVEGMRLTSTGLGIGITPGLPLDVAGSIRSLMSGIDARVVGDIGGASGIGTWSNHHLIFATNGAEAMRILANGRVCINKPGGSSSRFAVVGLPVYADRAAAILGGLTTGDGYVTAAGVAMYV